MKQNTKSGEKVRDFINNPAWKKGKKIILLKRYAMLLLSCRNAIINKTKFSCERIDYSGNIKSLLQRFP